MIGFDNERLPTGYKGSRTLEELTALYDACFRIQREAIAATGHSRTCPECDGEATTRGLCRCERCDGKGHVWVGTRHIPLVVENVKGAQPWVGRAKWHYGSFFLWGDVPALMPSTLTVQKRNPDGTEHGVGSWFAIADSKNRGASKNDGGSWFDIGSPGQKETGRNPVNGVKGNGGGWYGDYKEQKTSGRGASTRQTSSHSPARKAASAQIAKIPFDLALAVARAFKPPLIPTAFSFP